MLTEMGNFNDELIKAGVLLAADGLRPSSYGKRVRFAETTGRQGVLPEGGVEWMRAGNGVWHTGEAEPGKVKVFQLCEHDVVSHAAGTAPMVNV